MSELNTGNPDQLLQLTSFDMKRSIAIAKMLRTDMHKRITRMGLPGNSLSRRPASQFESLDLGCQADERSLATGGSARLAMRIEHVRIAGCAIVRDLDHTDAGFEKLLRVN